MSYCESTEKNPKKSSLQLNEEEAKHTGGWLRTDTHFTSDSDVQQKDK